MLHRLSKIHAENSAESWGKGISYEVEFWTRWANTKGAEWPEDFRKRVEGKTEFQLASYLERFEPKKAVVLDVGAGPISFIGPIWPGVELTIKAVDPLAREYDRILEAENIVPPIRTEQCAVEELANVFGSNIFDLVHCCNALDHSRDPFLGIAQMLSVVKMDHPVVLVHQNDEAETEGYTGFHQWNFRIEGSNFVIWRQDLRVDVTQLFSECAKAEVRWNEQGSHVVVFWKTNDISAAMLEGDSDDRP